MLWIFKFPRQVVGRNKPVHGRFRQKYPGKCGLLRRKRPPGWVYSGLHLSFNGSVRNISQSFPLHKRLKRNRPVGGDGLHMRAAFDQCQMSRSGRDVPGDQVFAIDFLQGQAEGSTMHPK